MSGEKNIILNSHKLCLDNREKLCMEGIKSVEAFSDKDIVLFSVMGKIIIKGENLHIEKFNKDTGEFLSTGRVSSIVYSKGTAQKSSFVERLFK